MNPLSRPQSKAIQALLAQHVSQRHVSQNLSDPGFVVLPCELPNPAPEFVVRHPTDQAAANLVANLVGEYSKLNDEQLRAQLLTQLAQCDADEAANPLQAQRAADRVLGPDRAASGPNRSTDRVSGRSVDSRLGVPSVRMPAVSRASGWTEEQLLAELIMPAAELARPPISSFHVGWVGGAARC